MIISREFRFCCSILLPLLGVGCGSVGEINGQRPEEDANVNSCGGTALLIAEPGERCGASGLWQCDGMNALHCSESETNACGGTAPLTAKPGESCGTAGQWQCDGMNALRCSESEINACGGTRVLDDSPGAPCGACGTWVCADQDALSCRDPGENACGGCSALKETVGDPCSACGVYVCAGKEALSCEDSGQNACGGCSALSHMPGTPCETSGTWNCSGSDALVCTVTVPLPPPVPVPVPLPPPLPCLDKPFDLSQIVEWRDLKGRPLPSTYKVVSDLTVTADSAGWLYFDFHQPATWVGDGTTCSDFFVIYKDAGVWVAQTAEHLGCLESQHKKLFAYDWGPDNEWYRISPGDPVGFLVTSQAAPFGNHVPMYERTSLAMMCW